MIILIVVLYIKLVDLKVANLTVTNKALVGYSNWSDPAILQAPPTGQAGAPTTYSLITPSFLEQRSSSINVTTVDTQLESLNSGTTLSNSALTVTRAFFDTIKAVTIAFNVSLIKNSASARATLNATTLEISSQLNATTLNAEKLDVPVIHAQTMSLSNSKTDCKHTRVYRVHDGRYNCSSNLDGRNHYDFHSQRWRSWKYILYYRRSSNGYTSGS